jgi:hypothetical protein
MEQRKINPTKLAQLPLLFVAFTVAFAGKDT